MKRRVSAVEARKRLGEILEGVYYRGDEVVIERAGKPMGVILPPRIYGNMVRRREELWQAIEATWERHKNLTPDEITEIERDIDKAVQDVRAKMRAERPAERQAAKRSTEPAST